MNTRKFPVRTFLIVATMASSLPTNGHAALVVWGGGNGSYLSGGNWVDGLVPDTNSGDTARINGGEVIYTPGGDFHVHNNGNLEINGGSWTQAGGDAYIQLGGGKLTVAGGTFNQGTAGQIARDSGTTISVTAGVANFNGDFINSTASGTFTLGGTGTVNIAREFKPVTTIALSSGTLNATLISFADGPGRIDFSGGTISVDGSNSHGGFYAGGDTGPEGRKSLNFTGGSGGTLFFRNISLVDLVGRSFFSNGTLSYNGAIDPGAFNTTVADGGVYVTVVPETSASLLLLAGMSVFTARRRRGNHA